MESYRQLERIAEQFLRSVSRIGIFVAVRDTHRGQMVEQTALGLVTLCLLMVSTSAEAQLFPRRTKAKRVCCFKSYYNYNEDRLSNPETELTFAAISTPAANTERPGVPHPHDKKSFSLQKTALRSDHCELSQVAFECRRDGTWTFSCHAKQETSLVTAELQPMFVRYTRNRFQVTIRPQVQFQTNSETAATVLARPAVAAVVLPDWWLDRNHSRNIILHGKSAAIAANFEQLDRLAIDLQYE